MKNRPSLLEVRALVQKYPCGTRVRLLQMHDLIKNLPLGLEGNVISVNEEGTVLIEWDNRITMGAVFYYDEIKKI